MKLIYTAVLCVLISSCASRRVAYVEPYLSNGYVLSWGRVIPIVDGKESYRNCKIQVGAYNVPLDSNGIFMIKNREGQTSLKSLTCGNRSVLLPTNYARIHEGAGPRSIYLGNVIVKFGKRSYDRRLSSSYKNIGHGYELSHAEYFAVQNHYARDWALLSTRWNIAHNLKARRSILETPGVPPSRSYSIENRSRMPASTSPTRTSKHRSYISNNLDSYDYDFY